MGKRCEEKIRFDTPAECYREILRGSRRGKYVMDWYFCKGCNGYHLTHRH